MDKKEFSVSLLIIGLTILFAAVSFALFLSRGKSKFFTAKKMKLGALILSLTMTAQSCDLFITCYDEAEPDNNLYLYLQDTVNLNDSTRFIKGEIYNRTSNSFSYKLSNRENESLSFTDNIRAEDGAYDEYNEEFTIELDTNLQLGDYLLQIYNSQTNNQVDDNLNRAFTFSLIRE